MHFFFCKAYKTYQAIALLSDAGFVEDAEVLSRTLFELFLQAEWMSTKPKEMARSFVEHAAVRNYNLYLRIKTLQGARIDAVVSRIESQPSELAKLKQLYDQFKLKFLRPGRRIANSPNGLADNWWGHSVRWLAEKVGVEELYATVYWSQSDLVHTGSTSINDYLKWNNKDGWQANCYPNPQNEECGLTVLWASGWFVRICEILNAAWGLQLDADIKQPLEAIDELARRTGALPLRPA